MRDDRYVENITYSDLEGNFNYFEERLLRLEKRLIDCMCPESKNHKSNKCPQKTKEFLCEDCKKECYE